GMDDDVEKYLGNRTTFRSHGRVRMQRSLFHGHGGEAPSQKKNILRYFHRVDEGLNKLLEDQSIPMMLAGVEYLLPIFQEASSYDRILDEGLLGNPEEVETKELHALAWEIVEPLFKEQQEQSTEKFLKFFGQGSELASTDLATIVKAAVQGRVETLFVPLDVQRWGRYDRQKNEVILEAESGVDNEDLLDFAAMRTVMHSGTVYALPMADLPGGAEQAAILRYAV
ncbi:MAG: hypothetical protein RBT34_02435, partial [Anaerolineaceae bacterium]|nr:hypothetical protein [Anaerolineaceae bacterium]